MRDQLTTILTEQRELENQLHDLNVVSDPAALKRIGKRLSELEPLIPLAKEYQACEEAIAQVDQMRDDPELLKLAEEEALEAKSRLPVLEEKIRSLLLPKDPNDDRPIIMEVRAGTGGEEAALFAAELLRMYLRYADRQGWKSELFSKSNADAGGIKEAIVRISGENVYGRMKYESGVHRVQRVPATESKGRLHTSAASIVILPEAEEVDIVLRPDELRIDVFRSSGPGGQSVNTTDSAVRITHLPTGTLVSCQDEKSQRKNKEKAMKILRSRLYAIEQERQAKERGEKRLEQIGSGDRSDKIRTYNFPQDRVTDHRIKQNFSNLPIILDGHLDEIIRALLEEQKRLV